MYFESYFLTSFEYVIVIMCDVVSEAWLTIIGLMFFSGCVKFYFVLDFFAVGQRRWFTLLSTHAAKLPLADVNSCPVEVAAGRYHLIAWGKTSNRRHQSSCRRSPRVP